MLQMIVAEKLGMTLRALRAEITVHELILWSGFYELRKQEEAKLRAKHGH